MGRPPLGDAARTVPAGLKISKAEEADLTVEFGNPGRGLRALIDLWYEMRETPTSTTISEAVPGLAPRAPSPDYNPVEVLAAIEATGKHRHKRDHIGNERYVQGVRTPVWVCACGQELT
jgi:hypothetical protein